MEQPDEANDLDNLDYQYEDHDNNQKQMQERKRVEGDGESEPAEGSAIGSGQKKARAAQQLFDLPVDDLLRLRNSKGQYLCHSCIASVINANPKPTFLDSTVFRGVVVIQCDKCKQSWQNRSCCSERKTASSGNEVHIAVNVFVPGCACKFFKDDFCARIEDKGKDANRRTGANKAYPRFTSCFGPDSKV